jgi:hypothetical protein
MDPATWIEIDEHYESEIAEKRRLLADRRAEVFVTLPAGLGGSREVLAKLVEFLPERFPERFAGGPDIDDSLHPLESASLLVQEDLAVMTAQNGQWVLTAASVCFPSRWDLASKLGADMHGIHQPVPHYEERIGAATDAAFDKMTPDRPVWRINWTVLDDPELFQPSAAGRKTGARARPGAEEFGDATHQGLQIDGSRVELELAGLQAGVVEQVVDKAQQVFGGIAGRLGIGALGPVQTGAGQKADHADDAVQRRTHLVAHQA